MCHCRKFSALTTEDHRVLFVGIEPVLSISAMLSTKVCLWHANWISIYKPDNILYVHYRLRKFPLCGQFRCHWPTNYLICIIFVTFTIPRVTLPQVNSFCKGDPSCLRWYVLKNLNQSRPLVVKCFNFFGTLSCFMQVFP